MTGVPGILYPPTLDFDFLIQRPQQLLIALSLLGVTVYFLNRPAYQKGDFRGIEKYNENLYLFHHITPSYPFNIKPVVYYSNPTQAGSLGKYNPGLIVFDSVDEPVHEFSSWRPYYHQAVASADLVLAASEKLYTRARDINPHTLLLPNGCDFDYFNRARYEPLAQPADLPDLKGAVIGYIGAIASWCNLELLEQVALAFPDCSLLMIGPLYNVRNIPLLPNIHWLGYKDYEELICYARYFDVGIIPFKSGDMTEAVNPIKLWEYMALGIPVVSTALPEVWKYRELIYYSSQPVDFIHNVRRALKQENWERCEKRMALARRNSWMARAREMLQAITERMEARGVKVPGYLPAPNATPYRRKNYSCLQHHIKFPGPVRKIKISP